MEWFNPVKSSASLISQFGQVYFQFYDCLFVFIYFILLFYLQEFLRNFLHFETPMSVQINLVLY